MSYFKLNSGKNRLHRTPLDFDNDVFSEGFLSAVKKNETFLESFKCFHKNDTIIKKI